MILLIVAAAAPFSWILGIEQAPQLITEGIKSATTSPWMVLLLLNVVLLVLGCFMETLAIMIILVPILLPVLQSFNIDLTHFGIVLLVNLVIGQITPPVGVLLFVSGSISKTPLGSLVEGGVAVRRGADRRAHAPDLRARAVAVAAGDAEVTCARSARNATSRLRQAEACTRRTMTWSLPFPATAGKR